MGLAKVKEEEEEEEREETELGVWQWTKMAYVLMDICVFNHLSKQKDS